MDRYFGSDALSFTDRVFKPTQDMHNFIRFSQAPSAAVAASLPEASCPPVSLGELNYALAACNKALSYPHHTVACSDSLTVSPTTVHCWDMSSLKNALCLANSGTGQVCEIVKNCVFIPREQAFTSLIKFCGSLGEWQKAIELFEAMHYVPNVKPNTYTYSALIAACSTSGQWYKAVENDLECLPNKVTFCAVISACEKGGLYKKALEVFQQMLLSGITADEWSLRAALSSCQKSGNWNFAQQILMSVRGSASDVALPPVILSGMKNDDWKSAINIWLASKNPSTDTTAAKLKSLEVSSSSGSFRSKCQMSMEKPAWDMDTLKRLICMAKMGTGEVKRVIETCTFLPRAQAFTSLINMCGRMRDWQKACEVFEAMKCVRGVQPNTYTFSALIAACSTSGEWERALEVFYIMKREAQIDPSCTPNEVTYSTVITACQRGGLVEQAVTLYEEMIGGGLIPDQGSFNSILAACERNEKWEMAEKILSDMHKQGLTGNPSIYCELIEAYGKRQEWVKIVDIYNELKFISGRPEEAIRQEVVKTLERGGQHQKIIEIFGDLFRKSSESSVSIEMLSIASRSSLMHTASQDAEDDYVFGYGLPLVVKESLDSIGIDVDAQDSSSS